MWRLKRLTYVHTLTETEAPTLNMRASRETNHSILYLYFSINRQYANSDALVQIDHVLWEVHFGYPELPWDSLYGRREECCFNRASRLSFSLGRAWYPSGTEKNLAFTI